MWPNGGEAANAICPIHVPTVWTFQTPLPAIIAYTKRIVN